LKSLVVYNPRSGRSARNARLLPLVREWVAANRDVRLAMTEGPGHATALARDGVAGGCGRVIAVGGDGTLNETAQALVGAPAALGLVPCGSGNGLARHLKLPLEPADALRLQANAAARIEAIDTGVADGRPFFNAMGLGLDAEVSRRFNQLTTRRGPLAYGGAVWEAYRAYQPESCAIAAGSELLPFRAMLISVLNSDQYGNNARIAPGASVTDGQLDLIAVPPTSLWSAPGMALKLFAGSFDRIDGVRHLRSDRFRIERARPGLIHTDGETHEAGATVEVTVRRASLRVVLSP
jgi:YegS/Rv2252/BmrU family lipid kinase